MAASNPSIAHILNKDNYSKHRNVVLPQEPLSALPPSSIRVQSKILGLTTNNFSYARFGHLLGWWEIYPLPTNTPAPFNDSNNYGRIAAWGYAEILESNIPSIPVGHTVYGFLPIATQPEILTVEQTGYKNQIVETSPGRQQLWKQYNRYEITAPMAELEQSPGLDFLAWDALMQGLFATSYNMNKYAFGWTDEMISHPAGQNVTFNTGGESWTKKDAELTGATVFVLSASGKTAMAFAHQVRYNRPEEFQPKTIIAVGSEASRGTSEKSGFYDRTVLYWDARALKEELGKEEPCPVKIVDFGAREGARESWEKEIAALPSSFHKTLVSVGGEVKVQTPEEATARMSTFTSGFQVDANELKEMGIRLAGGDAYFEEFYRKFDDFKAGGAIPGVALTWGSGLEDWEKGWEALCKDEVKADTALVYKL